MAGRRRHPAAYWERGTHAMTTLSDAQLLERFRAGDEVALEALFERYESGLFHFLLGMLRDHHAAEDALQETFIKALQHSAAVLRGESLKSWLFTVAYRQAMLAKRKQKRKAEPTAGDEATYSVPSLLLPPDESLSQAEQARRVRELLEQLPAAQREVIRARIYEGKTYRQIAAEMACPLNTALARMHEGLKRLRSLWEQPHA